MCKDALPNILLAWTIWSMNWHEQSGVWTNTNHLMELKLANLKYGRAIGDLWLKLLKLYMVIMIMRLFVPIFLLTEL